MSQNIGRFKFHLSNATNAFKQFHGVHKARLLALGEVHLGRVPGNDRLAVGTESGEEHFHLFGGGVLRLVQDDKSPLERAASHIGERGDFDGSGFFVVTEFFGR